MKNKLCTLTTFMLSLLCFFDDVHPSRLLTNGLNEGREGGCCVLSPIPSMYVVPMLTHKFRHLSSDLCVK